MMETQERDVTLLHRLFSNLFPRKPAPHIEPSEMTRAIFTRRASAMCNRNKPMIERYLGKIEALKGRGK